MDCLADGLIVVDLQPALLVRLVQGTLEVLRDFIFVKLLLNTVDDRHDPLDILVKDVTLLQTLESYLTLVSILLEFLVDLNCLQASVSYIIHHRARPLV